MSAIVLDKIREIFKFSWEESRENKIRESIIA